MLRLCGSRLCSAAWWLQVSGVGLEDLKFRVLGLGLRALQLRDLELNPKPYRVSGLGLWGAHPAAFDPDRFLKSMPKAPSPSCEQQSPCTQSPLGGLSLRACVWFGLKAKGFGL